MPHCILKPSYRVYKRIPNHADTTLYQIEPNGSEPIEQGNLQLGDLVKFDTIVGYSFDYKMEVGKVVGLFPTVLMMEMGDLEPFELPRNNDLSGKTIPANYGISGTLPNINGARLYLLRAYNDIGTYMKSAILPIKINTGNTNYIDRLFIPAINDYV